jgi:hypothetical protein
LVKGDKEDKIDGKSLKSFSLSLTEWVGYSILILSFVGSILTIFGAPQTIVDKISFIKEVLKDNDKVMQDLRKMRVPKKSTEETDDN